MEQAKRANFGLMFSQSGLNADTLMARARLADKFDYHSVWVADHFWPAVQAERDQLECLTLMSAMAACTERVRIGSTVICYAFRNPGLLAKSLCSIDQLSHGRLEIGLGAGYREDEFTGYGYEFPPVPVRLRQFEEAVQILKAMFVEPKVTWRGKFYNLTDALNNPKPVQKPHPPITIGGGGRKVMLRLVAKYADAWNFGGANPYFDELLATLKGHCEAIGRDFNTLRISEVVIVSLGRTEQEAQEKFRAIQSTMRAAPNAIVGTADQVIADFKRRIAKGVSLFMMHFAEGHTAEALERFSKEVLPALR